MLNNGKVIAVRLIVRLLLPVHQQQQQHHHTRVMVKLHLSIYTVFAQQCWLFISRLLRNLYCWLNQNNTTSLSYYVRLGEILVAVYASYYTRNLTVLLLAWKYYKLHYNALNLKQKKKSRNSTATEKLLVDQCML